MSNWGYLRVLLLGAFLGGGVVLPISQGESKRVCNAPH